MQVSEAIHWCGTQLLWDKRLIAISRGARAGAHTADSAVEAALRLVAVAQQASSGAFKDMTAFRCAVNKAVQKCISQPVLSALADQIECWCYSMAKCVRS